MASEVSCKPENLTIVEIYLRQLINNAELNDVTFLCQDGCRIHGCRILLAARSAFFKGLLFGEMMEAKNSDVPLPTVPSSVLIVVMKFLYTDKLLPEDLDLSTSTNSNSCIHDDSCSPRLDKNFLLEIIATARFLLLDDLERVIIDRLENDVPKGNSLMEDSLTRVARGLSALYDHASLWQGESEGNPFKEIRSSMVRALMSQDLGVTTLSNISEAAFCSYLKDTQGFYGHGARGLVLDGYLRFRQILTWCAVSGGLCASLSLDRTCLPGPEVAMEYIEWKRGNSSVDDSAIAQFDFKHGRVDFLQRITEESLKPVLPFADVTLVHPELQSSVVEPILSHIIGIMDPMHLASILCVQACEASKRLREDKDSSLPNLWHVFGDANVWKVPTEDDRSFCFTVQREVASFTLKAIAAVRMSNPVNPKCRWEMGVAPRGPWEEQQSMANFEFGFIFRDPGKRFTDELTTPLSLDYGSSALRIRDDLKTAYIYSNGRKMKQWNLPNGKQFRWRTPLEVTLERQGGANRLLCSFSYGGDKTTFSVFQVDYSQQSYPAISLSNQSPFKPHHEQWTVKIENIVGMEYVVDTGGRSERAAFTTKQCFNLQARLYEGGERESKSAENHIFKV
ncbi:hypothetical protein R1sor_015724 [Riccia sorocarpa]|uniref:BTB domain-containing protein n=1 Tax=Riccia sorocarpa TaxID=122646 RepID=A0ABD3HD10_9MARC